MNILKKMTVYICECGEDTINWSQICNECCEHEELDHGVCMDCGDDQTEELMAKAYDRMKGD